MEQIPLNQVCFIDPLSGSKLSTSEQLCMKKRINIIELFEVSFMIQETTKLLIRKNGLQPSNALNEQFFITKQFILSLNTFFKGEQVLLKSYSSFSGYQINRICFVINLSKVFEFNDGCYTFLLKLFEDKSGFDYQQIIRLICSDFPKEQLILSFQLLSQNNEQDEDEIMKKYYNGSSTLKAILFCIVFEDFLKFINKQIAFNNSVEYVSAQILEKYYQTSNPPFLPSQVSVFEVLLKFSGCGYQISQSPIMVFKRSMMSDKQFLSNGFVNYKQFVTHLFQSPKNDQYLQRLIRCVDRSNARQQDMVRIVQEKSQYEADDEQGRKKDKK